MLQILKASAGSGKTFRLTREYIRLLFKAKYANAHRSILAVTFTNKATDEMKSRILQELNRLANGGKSPYREDLCAEFNCNEESINKKAQEIMVEILHDYSYFSVSTIDRFFQQVIRSFTREIGLSGGYNVELDQKRVAAIAVDNMLANLDKTENKQLLEWLTRFSEDKIEKGENWDFRWNINALSGELSKEEYRLMSQNMGEKLADKNFLAQYQSKMYAILRKFETDLQQIALRALPIIDDCLLEVTDFKGGANSSMKYWHKILNKDFSEPTKTFYGFQNDLPAWSAKTVSSDIKNKIEQAYNNGLNDCIVEVCTMFDAQFRTYKTAKEIIKNFYTLGILTDIDRQMKAYLNERNQILLSDSTHLLNMVIDGSDTPFVYEKIGTRIAHFMIDEFQDTSQMQWQNFRPLLKNSLDQNYRNLIVGDVKQSIYRFRNSDWKLLDSQLDKDFRAEDVDHETLFTNYRSDKNIVDFNNAFFDFASIFLQEQFNADAETAENKILHAYSDVYQQLPNNKNEGHV
ncbi:MAG: UvrD-helicase domain-containing protein, partial [Prevotellaceae bacterium]|nr:UvrD-helicase domain-containing protein [Prevotellaceae bacterium]